MESPSTSVPEEVPSVVSSYRSSGVGRADSITLLSEHVSSDQYDADDGGSVPRVR